jgi:hypothetical protein
VTLATSGLHGTSVSWASSGSYITSAGVVTRPGTAQGDTAVDLTATITRGSASDTRVFSPVVKCRTNVTWAFVDGNTDVGLNYSSVRHATDPALAALGDDLYVAWTESSTSTTQIRVRRYDGSTWTWLDGGAGTGINRDTAQNASQPSLFVFGGSVYAIFSELYLGSSVTRVKRHDGGTTWTSIDGSATNGLNRQVATSQNPTLGACGGSMYAAWVESYGGAMQLHVKRYDGGTAWTFVDGDALTGLNYDSSRGATSPKLGCLDGVLHLVWTENNPSNRSQVRLRRYDGGSTWTWIDGGASAGLNYNSSNTADKPGLVALDGTLHVYWLENYTVRVKRYSGGAWTSADGSMGYKQNALNYAYAESAPRAVPSLSGRSLLFTWGEDISYDPWSIQTRAATYDGSAMTFVDGNDWTTGLNKDRLRYAYAQAITVLDDALWIAWHESNGTANQIRVIRGSNGT